MSAYVVFKLDKTLDEQEPRPLLPGMRITEVSGWDYRGWREERTKSRSTVTFGP
jgi:hypothetical protein